MSQALVRLSYATIPARTFKNLRVILIKYHYSQSRRLCPKLKTIPKTQIRCQARFRTKQKLCAYRLIKLRTVEFSLPDSQQLKSVEACRLIHRQALSE